VSGLGVAVGGDADTGRGDDLHAVHRIYLRRRPINHPLCRHSLLEHGQQRLAVEPAFALGIADEPAEQQKRRVI
jgi:hypothetical protein